MKKSNKIALNTDRILTFISENRNVIAVVGGIATGITLASLLGNDRAKQLLRTFGTSVKDMSGKVMEDLSGYKDLLSPLLSKNPAQGL